MAWKIVHQEEGKAVGHVALQDDTGAMVKYMIVGIGPQIGKLVRITVEVQEDKEA